MARAKQLESVLRAGKPISATLCFPGSDDGTGEPARKLGAAKAIAALRDAGPLDKDVLCPTDSQEATLVLRYSGGGQRELLIETMCPSVVQPKTNVDGDQDVYFRGPYVELFALPE